MPESFKESVTRRAEEIRTEMTSKGLATDGIDFEKLAAFQAEDSTRAVPGWCAPEAPTHEWIAELPDVHGGRRYINRRASLIVIFSCATEDDGRAWLHLSVSRIRKDRLPSWGELVHVKRLFLGNRYAYQVLPPQQMHVSIAEVLHMFALLDEEAPAPLPDFTGGTGSI